MRLIKTCLVAVVAVTVFGYSVGRAQQSDASLQQQLRRMSERLEAMDHAMQLAEQRHRQQVQGLEQRVGDLQGRLGDTWLDEQRAEHIRRQVAETLSDARQRTSYDGGPAQATAGWKDHPYLSSPDGRNLLWIAGHIQIRYYFNVREDPPNNPAANPPVINHRITNGFQVQQAKLKFGGHVGDPRFEYLMEVSLSSSGSFNFGDVWGAFEPAGGWQVIIGKTGAPFLREEMVDDVYQLAVNRSLVHDIFNLCDDIGIRVNYTGNDMFHAYAMIYSGGDTSRLSVNIGGATGWSFDQAPNDFAMSGRVEMKLLGDWDEFNDFNGWAGEPLGIMVGTAVNYLHGRNFMNRGAAWHELSYTMDVSFKYDGWTAFLAGVGEYGDPSDQGCWNVFGAVAQLGYNVNGSIEPFIRMDVYLPTAGAPVSQTSQALPILTLGTNYFIRGNDLKFTADVLWAMGQVRAADPSVGLLIDGPGDKNQVVLRMQFQLLF